MATACCCGLSKLHPSSIEGTAGNNPNKTQAICVVYTHGRPMFFSRHALTSLTFKTWLELVSCRVTLCIEPRLCSQCSDNFGDALLLLAFILLTHALPSMSGKYSRLSFVVKGVFPLRLAVALARLQIVQLLLLHHADVHLVGGQVSPLLGSSWPHAHCTELASLRSVYTFFDPICLCHSFCKAPTLLATQTSL